MHIPRATYRVQITPTFGFRALKEIVPYLAELGISDIYASPIFKARKGSRHGYDIVEPNLLNPELGAGEDFEELFCEVRRKGMSWLQDIVPNHMAFDSQNRMLMDVLEKGEASPYIHFFDIDWEHPYESIKGKVLAPFLGKLYAEALEAQEIRLEYSALGLSLKYEDLIFPVRAVSYSSVFAKDLETLEKSLGAWSGPYKKFHSILDRLKRYAAAVPAHKERIEDFIEAKEAMWQLYNAQAPVKKHVDEVIASFNGKEGVSRSFDELHRLHQEQVFRFSFWKVATEELNYRRFFTVNGLICLNIETAEVFDAMHGLILKMMKDGKFAGVRIDHIDGLYDPTAYLKKMRAASPDAYMVVEKILGRNEVLPASWPVHGTTGYEFLNYLNGLFCKKENEKDFTKIYERFVHPRTSCDDLIIDTKRLMIGKHLAGDIDNLAQYLKAAASKDRYGHDITLYGLKRALVELMAFFPVYRTYINHDAISESDEAYMREAMQRAKKSSPGLLYELNFIEKFFLAKSRASSAEEEKLRMDFVMSFQQYTPALMAKGFEDTFCYRYNRLVSLNEVGGNPKVMGLSVRDFHDLNADRARRYANSLNTTSTHDTKRGEDVRARINVLSEIPKEWNDAVKRWTRINKAKKTIADRGAMPDENDEWLIYQTLVGSFPFDMADIDDYRQRLRAYIIKAVREAKVHTGWIKPDSEYEDACTRFVDGILDDSGKNGFLDDFLPFQKRLASYGILNSLSQVMIKITSPGIPDFYQGSELWDLNLVDPDNRRDVDFRKRISCLEYFRENGDIAGMAQELLGTKEDGRIKLFLIHKLLRARNENERLFASGEYMPLETGGKFKENIVGYARRLEDSWAIVTAPRFFTSIIKAEELPLGEKAWGDTHIILPKGAPAEWADAITKKTVHYDGKLFIKDLLEHLPASMLTNMK